MKGDYMFTAYEIGLLRFILQNKLETAKEITKVATKEHKEACKNTEHLLESILEKINMDGGSNGTTN